ncbi:MAG: sulfate transporter CysZ [Methylococcaceae bacterium]
MNSPVQAFKCLFQGFNLLMQPELRHFIIAPLIINLLLFGLALVTGVHYFAVFMNNIIPGWLEFLVWLIWPLFGLSFLLMVYFSFTLIANVIASPFYSILAEKAIQHIEGERGVVSQSKISQAVVTGITSSLKRLGYFLLRAIPLLILFIIPGVNLVAPFVWMAFSAWVVAQEYMAYPLEAKGYDFTRQRGVVKTMRLGLLTYGGLIMLGLAIPLLNILIPPAAVVGAVLLQKDDA